MLHAVKVFLPVDGGHLCQTCGAIVGDPRDVPGHRCFPMGARRDMGCIYRGDEIRRELCPSCPAGNVQLKILACDLHGECCIDKTVDGVRSCSGCQDKQPPLSPYALTKPDPGLFAPPSPQFLPAVPPAVPFVYGPAPEVAAVALTAPVRHLAFHIWPIRGNPFWRWHCDHLLSRIEIFNGRRIAAIAMDAGCDSSEAVRQHLRGFDFEFLEVPNNPALREVATFPWMLERLQAYNSDQDLTFFCHAKGVRHKTGPEDEASTLGRWSRAMYRANLDDLEAVHRALETHATAGIFRQFVDRPGWGPWHYSGTFFWMRNRDVFGRDWRAALPNAWYGVEAFPGMLFRPSEARCLLADGIADLYGMANYEAIAGREMAEWERSHP